VILHLKYRGHFTIADGLAFTIETQLRGRQYTWYILMGDAMSPKILLDVKGRRLDGTMSKVVLTFD